MKSDKIRNFSLVGEVGSGKTSLSDLILYKTGKVNRLGKVDDKTSVSDYTHEEQEKQSSVFSSIINCSWKDYSLCFLDAPAYGEFIAEQISAIRNTDLGLITLDSEEGLQMGTKRAWDIAKENNIPRAIYINGLDKERSDFNNTLSQLQEIYGKTVCLPITYPIGESSSLEKVVNILSSDDLPEGAAKYKEQILDAVAESDEELMMRYLDGETLTEEEISNGLRQSILEGALVPVFAGSVEQDLGIDELLDCIVNLFPKPLDKKEISDKEGNTIELNEEEPGLAKVFKSINDPFLGQLAIFRVYKGIFEADSEVYNVSRKAKERFGPILILNGKNQEKVSEAVPGTMGAMLKLKSTELGDTIATSNTAPELPEIEFPKPVMHYAITAAKSGEEDKIGTGLNKIISSDPTLKLERHPETFELILSGMGDEHLNLVIKKLKENQKVDVNVKAPKVPYRETITSNGEGHYRHKKQTGGHGQFAEVYLRVEPNQDGYEFHNEVVGGNIPKNFIPAVEKGVQEAMQDGPLAGCNVQNIKVTVYDGKYHEVDSSEMAFKIASRAAFRDAIENAKPILMEPINSLKINIPDKYMGDINADLNQKRGKILGMDLQEGMQIVKAEAPASELSRYATELRSITQGNGTFDMEFIRYEKVPSNIAQQIIEQHKKETEEESNK